MLKRLVGIFAAAFLLGGCAANKYCLGEFEYQKAASVPELQGADGLSLPPSARAYRIPDAPANAEPYGQTYKDADGDERARCLDLPPTMAGLDTYETPAVPEKVVTPPTRPKSPKRPKKPTKPADAEPKS